MNSLRDGRALTPAGFPHSEILGSKPVCGSPRLIAAYRVLHRLSAPRHPPCTLSSLTKLEFSFFRRILSLLTRFSCQRTSWDQVEIRGEPPPPPELGEGAAHRASQITVCLERTSRRHAALRAACPGYVAVRACRARLPCALAMQMVELIGFEPTTSALQGRRSPN
jgi:hypothetical protein